MSAATETEVAHALLANILDAIDTAEDDDHAREQLAAYEELLDSPERLKALVEEIGEREEMAMPVIIDDAIRQRVRKLARKKYPEHLAQENEWTRYEGPHGGHGWKRGSTGEIVYQEEMPRSREDGTEKESAPSKGGSQVSGNAEYTKQAGAKEYKEKGTRAKAFRAWFGDWESDAENASKVVNPETGEPKETHPIPRAVYHGRGRKFDVFKEGESPGIVGFFSESKEYASNYGDVGEFYLNIRKPVDLSERGGPDARYTQSGKSVKRKVSEWFSMMQKQGVDTSKIDLGEELEMDDKVAYWDMLDASAGSVSKDSNLVSELRRQGFDGIIGREGDQDALAYVAFEPTQIKAVDNTGTFDPSDPRIHMGMERDA